MANNSSPKELATKKKTTSTPSTTSSSNKKSNKKTTKKVEKMVKKTAKKNSAAVVIGGLSLLVGLAGGFFGYKVLTKNDSFEINAYAYVNQTKNLNNETAKDLYPDLGEETAVLFVNEEYKEAGTTCVSFGKDISQDVKTTYYYREDISHDYSQVESVDTSVSGYYYAVYNIENFKYSKIDLIRNIIVLEVEVDG